MTALITRIKDYCDVSSSKRIYAREYVDDGVPFWRGKEIVERFKGKLEVSTELFISEGRYDEIKTRFGVPKVGDVLLTSVGTIGIPYIIRDGDNFYFKDGNITWFKTSNDVDPRYLFYWLISPHGKDKLSKCTIGAAQPAYTIERLKEVEFDPPGIVRQERIASILSAYDDLIENHRRRVALLEEAARLLYREWFVHFRFPGHEHVKIVDGLPEGWKQSTIGEHCPLIYGKALKAETRIHGDIDVYGSSGIVGAHNKRLVAGPAIVVGRKGNVGSIFWARRDFWPIDTVYYVSPENSNFYTYYSLQHVTFISTDVAVPGLNRDFAHSRKLLLPTDALLEGFHAQVEPIQAQIGLLERQIAELIKARDLLLPRLMDGRLEV